MPIKIYIITTSTSDSTFILIVEGECFKINYDIKIFLSIEPATFLHKVICVDLIDVSDTCVDYGLLRD